MDLNKIDSTLVSSPATLAALVTLVGNDKTIIVKTNVQVSATINLATLGISVQFVDAGRFTVMAGATLTMGTILGTPMWQIFDGLGGVVFASTVGIVPQWFGATGNGVSDDLVAIRAADVSAVLSSCCLLFPKGTYLCSVDPGIISCCLAVSEGILSIGGISYYTGTLRNDSRGVYVKSPMNPTVGDLVRIWNNATANTANRSRITLSLSDDAGVEKTAASIRGRLTNITTASTAGAVDIFSRDGSGISILDGGRLGINTTTPAAKLAVNGGAHVGGDSDPGDNNLLVDGTITAASGDITATDGDVVVADDTHSVKLGAGGDMLVYYDGTNGNIDTDAVAASDLTIDCGTAKTLVLEVPVYDDLRIVPGSFDFPGTTDPTLQNWQPGGSGTTFKVYKFNQSQQGYFTCQLPHGYKVGTDITVHVHWTPGDRGTTEGTATVAWKVDYSWANIEGVFGASATADCTDACQSTNDEHLMSPGVTITGTDKGISSMLVCRIYRDTGDTWAGTAANGPALLEVDFHYQIDTVGSRTISSK